MVGKLLSSCVSRPLITAFRSRRVPATGLCLVPRNMRTVKAPRRERGTGRAGGGGMAKPKRYVYEHPAEAGFGEHHADPAHPPLDERPAQPPAAVAGIKALIDSVPLSAEAHDELYGLLDRSMADLDLKHGTVGTLRVHDDGGHADERGQVVFEWFDQHGNPRATGIAPGFFDQHFREV